jgi:hypothetical protein
VPIALGEDDPPPAILQWIWFVGLLLLAVCCVIASFVGPAASILVALVLSPFIAVGLGQSYYRLFRGGLVLKLDLDAITIPRHFPVMPSRRVPWRDIEQFEMHPRSHEWVRYRLARHATPPDHRDVHNRYGNMTTDVLIAYLNEWVAMFNPSPLRDPYGAAPPADASAPKPRG